jgi:hypothetical protein
MESPQGRTQADVQVKAFTPLLPLEDFDAEWSIVLDQEKVSLVATTVGGGVLIRATAPFQLDDRDTVDQQVADLTKVLLWLRGAAERRLTLAKALNSTLGAEVFLEPIELEDEQHDF